LHTQFRLPKIYPITDPYISGISHLEQVTRLIRGGATLIQLRDKHAAPADFYAAAEECVALARQHGVMIIINDRVDIAKAATADGVHLGQDDMPASAARTLLGENAVVGLSTHSVNQADEARHLPVDYIAIGPIFFTKTKSDPEPAVGVDGVRSARSVIGEIPLVAIGGINKDNINDVLRAGAHSAALINALIGDADAITARINFLLG
jgi:thiamine-phosphate pyrophosphorylase